MPKLVHVPGAGNVEFPDDFTEDEITEALGKHFGTAPKEEEAPEPKKFDLSKIKLSPYEQAEYQYAEAGRGRPETGMESGTEFTTALGEAVQHPSEIPGEIAGTPGRLAQLALSKLSPVQQSQVQTLAGAAGIALGDYLKPKAFTAQLPGGTTAEFSGLSPFPSLQAPPEAGVGEKMATGGLNVLGGIGSFLMSPEGIGLQAAPTALSRMTGIAPKLAQKAVGYTAAAAFAPSLTAAAAQQWGQFAGSPDAQLGTEAAGTTALALLTAGGGVVLPRTLKEVARSIYAQRLRDNARQVSPPRLEPEIREGEGRPDLEQPAPGEPSRAAPGTEAAAPEAQRARLLLEQDIKTAQESNESIAARTAVGTERGTAMAERRQAAVRVASSAKDGDILVLEDGTRFELESLGKKSDAKGEYWARTEGSGKNSGGIMDVGVEIQAGGKIESKALAEQAKAKPAPAEPAKPRTLTPAVRVDEGTEIETGANHGEARFKHARQGRVAIKSQNEGFIDENGNWLTRSQAADRFYEMTGRRPAIPDALQSEDLKNANMLGHLLQAPAAEAPKPQPAAPPAAPAEGSIESVSKLSPTEFFDLSRKWSKEGLAGKGLGPQRIAEAAARANPDLAAWEKALAGAKAEWDAIKAEIANDKKSALKRQPEVAGATQKHAYFAEGIKQLKKMQAATQPVTPPVSEPPKRSAADIAEKWIKEQLPKAAKTPLGKSSSDAAHKVVSEWIQKGETPEGEIPKDTMDALMRSLGSTRDMETGEMLHPGDSEWPRTGTLLNFLESRELNRLPPPAAEPPKPAEAVPVPPKLAQPSPASEAPKAEVSIATEEPPHGVKLDVTTPAAHPLGPIATTTAPTLAWHQILTGELKEAGAGLRRFWRSFSMQSLPRITEADRRTGELGVRYDASRTVARVKGLEFAENVLAGIKAKGFDQQFGTALAEDNLRGIRKDFQDAAQRYRAEGKTEEADAALESAGKVTTLIGARNSPFASEAQYQAFLNAPEVQQAIRRHIQLWQEQKDPIYRKANDIDPNVVLETRGLQTGARINLKAVMPEEGTRTTVGAAGRSPLIRQAVTRLRKDPFARQAKGTGTSYEGSYREIMANGYEREFPVAAQHEFIKQMIDSGLAKVTVNREFPKGMLIRGESPKAFELKIGPWRNQWLQVPRSLAEEFQNVSGLTPGWNVPVVKPLSDLLTQASVQGFAEGSTHVSNLSTGILTNLGPTANPLLNTLIKSAGRVDVLYTLPRILIRGFTSTREEMLKLAEIGAAKTPYGGLMGWFINGIDRGVRLVSADVYDGMARKGWVKDTETGKREFINQVGQYSKRLQPTTIARLRETGVQPFATAMHTFNVQGLRTLGLGPGAKAPTALAALALRADKAAGIMGFIVLVTAINKLISGKATGPPGTQLGSVGWMGDDGKLRQFNLARAFGYERGLRTTGLQGFVEARRLGLPEATALGAGVRSIGQTGLGYVSGPATQFATKAITGKRPGIPMVQEAKVVPPPATDELQPLKTQAAANIAIALQQANPAVDAALMAMQGKEVPDILQRQFSRYTPRAGMSQETIEAMPKIMAAKQMGDYVTALAKEARKLPLAERNKFVRDRLWEDELTAQQQAQALQRLQVKGVFRYR